MKNRYKSLFTCLVILSISFTAFAQSVQSNNIYGSRTTSSNQNSTLSNPVYVSPAAVIFTDAFDGSNDTNALKSRGYIPYYRGGGPQGVAPTWFQGVPISALGPFDAFNGPDSGYVAANYQVVNGTHIIDSWLVLPPLDVAAGDTLSFYSQANPGSTFPDSIKIMYSAVGDSTPEDLWVLLDNFKVNTGGIWERKTFIAPSAGTTARFAIRYTVVNGGPTGTNGDYIGIDQLDVIEAGVSGGTCLDTAAFNGLIVAIPDDDPIGIDDVQAVSGIGGTALGTDVNLAMVCFNITHTYVGDLIVTVTGPNGAQVVLMDQPGVPATTFGCEGNDVQVCIELGTGNELENVCDIVNIPAISGIYTAANGIDLNVVNLAGGSPNGNWTLNISDNAAQDLGTLTDWSLIFATGPSAAWAASPDTLCESDPSVALDPLVTGTAGGTWSGSGVTGNNFDPSGLSGVITVTYTVTDIGSGCSDAESHDFFVDAAVPVCSFTPNIVNTTVSFTNTTTGAASYSWDFGDGNSDNTANPVHTYATNGTYTVVLSATNSCGISICTQTITVQGCPDLIIDGSFDNDSTSVTSPWIQASTNFVTPLCNAGCGLGGGTGPNTGAWWSWFGGIAATLEDASLTQTVTLPTGSTANLYFFLEIPVCDDPGDFMEVVIDGTDTVFHTDGGSALCTVQSYALQTINLDAYCDGNAHTIMFHSITLSPNGGVTNFFVDDVSILACPVGIEEPAIADHISILPNPASEGIHISIKELKADKVKIEISNAIGQSMFSKSILNRGADQNEYIDVAKWNSGMYIVTISAGDKSVIRKILVQ